MDFARAEEVIQQEELPAAAEVGPCGAQMAEMESLQSWAPRPREAEPLADADAAAQVLEAALSSCREADAMQGDWSACSACPGSGAHTSDCMRIVAFLCSPSRRANTAKVDDCIKPPCTICAPAGPTEFQVRASVVWNSPRHEVMYGARLI